MEALPRIFYFLSFPCFTLFLRRRLGNRRNGGPTLKQGNVKLPQSLYDWTATSMLKALSMRNSTGAVHLAARVEHWGSENPGLVYRKNSDKSPAPDTVSVCASHFRTSTI